MGTTLTSPGVWCWYPLQTATARFPSRRWLFASERREGSTRRCRRSLCVPFANRCVWFELRRPKRASKRRCSCFVGCATLLRSGGSQALPRPVGTPGLSRGTTTEDERNPVPLTPARNAWSRLPFRHSASPVSCPPSSSRREFYRERLGSCRLESTLCEEREVGRFPTPTRSRFRGRLVATGDCNDRELETDFVAAVLREYARKRCMSCWAPREKYVSCLLASLLACSNAPVLGYVLIFRSMPSQDCGLSVATKTGLLKAVFFCLARFVLLRAALLRSACSNPNIKWRASRFNPNRNACSYICLIRRLRCEMCLLRCEL